MVSSGLAKLTSGDPTWWPDLSALDFHFFTQPLPTPMAWSADQLPIQILQGCTLVMFFIELVLPFTMFGPRRLRLVSFFGLVLLQVLIALTGNYGFFNLLTLLLCVLLLDDSIFAKLRMRPNPGAGFLPSALLYPAGAVLIALSLVPFFSVLRGAIPLPKPLVDLHTMIAPYRTINGYGLFAVMTTSRKEILVQGSHDGYDWKTYSFRYKPGDPRRAPPVIAPRMPRLDWQMWFAALGPIHQSPWFVSFAQRLLEAEPTVLNLLESDPFEGQRPRFVRAVLDDYRFSTPIEKKESGLWWKAEPSAIYLNEVSLGPGR
jgi:hypothetical protein